MFYAQVPGSSARGQRSSVRVAPRRLVLSRCAAFARPRPCCLTRRPVAPSATSTLLNFSHAQYRETPHKELTLEANFSVLVDAGSKHHSLYIFAKGPSACGGGPTQSTEARPSAAGALAPAPPLFPSPQLAPLSQRLQRQSTRRCRPTRANSGQRGSRRWRQRSTTWPRPIGQRRSRTRSRSPARSRKSPIPCFPCSL